jgi:hypothetical protein
MKPRDAKVTRLISTKITDEEYNLLHRIARNYKLRGYIAKANTSEISRFILRVYIQWAFSHTSDQTVMNQTMGHSNGNSTVTMLGSNSVIGSDESNKTRESTDAASHGPFQSSNEALSAHQISDIICKILAPRTTIDYKQ